MSRKQAQLPIATPESQNGVRGGGDRKQNCPRPALISPVCTEESWPLLLLEWKQHQLDGRFSAIGWTHFPVYFSIELTIVEFSDLSSSLGFRLESRAFIANADVELTGISWLLVKMGMF